MKEKNNIIEFSRQSTKNRDIDIFNQLELENNQNPIFPEDEWEFLLKLINEIDLNKDNDDPNIRFVQKRNNFVCFKYDEKYFEKKDSNKLFFSLSETYKSLNDSSDLSVSLLKEQKQIISNCNNRLNSSLNNNTNDYTIFVKVESGLEKIEKIQIKRKSKSLKNFDKVIKFSKFNEKDNNIPIDKYAPFNLLINKPISEQAIKKDLIDDIIIPEEKPLINNKKEELIINNIKYSSLDNYNVFLIIEDNKDILSSHVRILDRVYKEIKKEKKLKKDILIIEGNDGIKALDLISNPLINSNLKGIFIDENMLFLNGSETIQIIKKLQKNKKIPNNKFDLVTVSAFDTINDENIAIAAGSDYAIRKPLSINHIRTHFQKYPLIEN